jgi:indolepyruvate ferredoxin oxidoreductase
LLSGVEVLGQVLLARRALDQRGGLDTATFVSGYPGSPLGTLDLALHRMADQLAAAKVHHQPGLNEELAATAVWGSQMGAAVPYRDLDGVVGAWYGKGPGLDRCGDVLKHANYMGVGPGGGAVLFVGDDPSAKSSTLPYDTNLALADAGVPVLVPADQQDLFDLGVEAFRLSRYCGSWVGVRIVTAVADGIGAVDTSLDRFPAFDPEVLVAGRPWRHEPSGKLVRPELEELWLDQRLQAARGWVAARGLDRVIGAGPDAGARLGVVCAGRTRRDVLGALETCGVAPTELAAAGIRILELALTSPVDPGPVLALADACDEVLVVEEKRPFVEQQVRTILHEAGHRTPVRGKRDATGSPLVPVAGELTAERIADVLVRVLPDLVRPAPAMIGRAALPMLPALEVPGRTPAFCSGCPHNRSTVVPAGSLTGGGVGCHGMVYMEARHADEPFVPPTPMGAEGVHWVGLAPFVDEDHLFQNLGDGTFSHSGSLAVRACVAAGAHMTFKILYNSAVAMTGGQDVAGLMDVPALTRSLAADGVGTITICTDDVHRYASDTAFAAGVTVRPREDVLAVQEELRATPGVSVLVYDQQCTAEARRLRKRGLQDEPPQRVVINPAVCEGCGDCSRVSNCLSVVPVETEFGERREIHQSSCNKDFSCLEGDCPSFLTIVPKSGGRGAAKATTHARPALPAGRLAEPALAPVDGRYSVYTTGIGGTGIVTANRLLAHAALAAGYVVRGVDQTGLSQKAGAVVSHLHIAATDDAITTATVADGDADLYLSGDVLQAGSAAHLKKVRPGRTWAVVDDALVPTASMMQGAAAVEPSRLTAAVTHAVGADRAVLADTTALAERVFGSHLPANVVLLGAASQLGALPVPPEAIEQAITTEGPAAAANLEAFAWGRWLVADPVAVEEALGAAGAGPTRDPGSIWDPSAGATAVAQRVVRGARVPDELRPLVLRRAGQLVDYQGRTRAERWLGLVERAAAVDGVDRGWALTEAVAEGWFKLLTYKDEYEVARLHLRLDLDAIAAEVGAGDGHEVQYHLHPPFLRRLGMTSKIEVGGATAHVAFRGLAAMKRVRGTRLDVFGRAKHRREEQALIEEYEALVLAALDGPYDEAVALAASVQSIKGYEDIKSRAIADWRAAHLGAPVATPALRP